MTLSWGWKLVADFSAWKIQLVLYEQSNNNDKHHKFKQSKYCTNKVTLSTSYQAINWILEPKEQKIQTIDIVEDKKKDLSRISQC